MLKGFREFLLRGNVLDLAVAVVIGAAFGAVITSLVEDILTPIIAAIFGRPDFSAIGVTLNGSRILVGEFLNAIIAFVLVGAALYFFVIAPVNAYQARLRRGEAPPDPTTKACPECLSQVPVAARRCAFCTTALVSLVFLAVAGFGQTPAPQRIDEMTVQRLNVVDANGTLRLVISNKDRMHPGVMDGVSINRPRPVAGLLFFNDEGDEVGGLTFTGQVRDGQRRASGGLMFDQLKQDQTVGISYSETNGQRTVGLQVWDRSDQPLSDLIRKLNAANALEDPAAREKAVQAARAAAPPGPRRVFVGKTSDRSATVSLADAAGKPRLTLKVDADGAASIDFLDAEGKVVQRLPAQQ